MKISRLFMCSLILAAVTLAAFWPALSNGFVNWDDDRYLVNNPAVKDLSWPSVRALFLTSNKEVLYAPLTLLSFAFEYHAFGLNPFVYHLDNVLLHVMNVLLLFGLMRWLTADLALSFLTAILFGIHPTRVESVAWITGRKDVFCALFFLSSLLAYGRYLDKGRVFLYVASLAFFCLAVLAKPVALTLPFVLLGMDALKGRRLWAGKIPFLAVLGALGAVFFFLNPVSHAAALTPADRGGIITHSLLMYLTLIVWPVSLSCFYPVPILPTGGWRLSVGLAPLVMAGLLLPVLRLYRRFFSVRVGLVFFLLTISMPLLFNHMTRPTYFVADRYLYIPAAGFFYIFSDLAIRWYRAVNPASRARMIASGLLCLTAALGVMTHERTKVWHDSVTLWSDVLRQYPQSSLARMQRALAYYQEGRYEKAQADFERIKGPNPYRIKNLACLYMAQGAWGQAVSLLEASAARDPAQSSFYAVKLATSYLALGEREKARLLFEQVLEGDHSADKREASYHLGLLYRQQADAETAKRYFEQSVRLDPGFAAGYYALAVMEAQEGHDEAAIRYYRQAVRADPSLAITPKS